MLYAVLTPNRLYRKKNKETVTGINSETKETEGLLKNVSANCQEIGTKVSRYNNWKTCN